APYRRFCRKFYDIGLVCVPMLYTKRIETDPKSIFFDLYKIEEERPLSVQLIGGDPNALKVSIDFLESYKFDLLDINAGCPSRRSINAKEGGYLLNDLINLQNIIRIAVKYSSRPISLKIRIGVDKPNKIEEMVKLINNSGLEFLIVHGRTVRDRFNDSKLNLKYIKQLKENISIPVIGNGDISNQIAAKRFLDSTGVDALMIGRGSMGNPELFNQIDMYLKNNISFSNNNDIKKFKKNVELYEKCIDEFIEGYKLINISLDEYKFIELKRNSIWLTKNIKDSSSIRTKLSKTKNLITLKKGLQCVFDSY
ncbi:MAG: tRNA-dihydrouridine synthase family protein, partial [Promethearchaeota archaeon]